MTAECLRERDVNGVTILTVTRGLKGNLESLLKERIDSLARQGKLYIVIDLKEVPYLDSSEIGRLIRAHLSMRQLGGRVRLCNLSDKVKSLLKISRLDTVLDLFATEDEALASLIDTQAQGAAQ